MKLHYKVLLLGSIFFKGVEVGEEGGGEGDGWWANDKEKGDVWDRGG